MFVPYPLMTLKSDILLTKYHIALTASSMSLSIEKAEHRQNTIVL